MTQGGYIGQEGIYIGKEGISNSLPLSKTRGPWIIGEVEWPFERDHHLRGKNVVNEP